MKSATNGTLSSVINGISQQKTFEQLLNAINQDEIIMKTKSRIHPMIGACPGCDPKRDRCCY